MVNSICCSDLPSGHKQIHIYAIIQRQDLFSFLLPFFSCIECPALFVSLIRIVWSVSLSLIFLHAFAGTSTWYPAAASAASLEYRHLVLLWHHKSAPLTWSAKERNIWDFDSETVSPVRSGFSIFDCNTLFYPFYPDCKYFEIFSLTFDCARWTCFAILFWPIPSM